MISSVLPPYYSYNSIYSIRIKKWIEAVGELVVQDCRDDLRVFREDRTSPSNLMTRMTSALDEIEGDISPIKELLEQGMAAP